MTIHDPLVVRDVFVAVVIVALIVLIVFCSSGCLTPERGQNDAGVSPVSTLKPNIDAKGDVRIDEMLNEFKQDVKAEISQVSYALDSERAKFLTAVIVALSLMSAGLSMILLCLSPPAKYRVVGMAIGAAIMVAGPSIVFLITRVL